MNAEETFVVRHEAGLHARPAALFVKTAQRFSAEIKVARDGKEVDAKSILSILSLGINQGMDVTVRALGPDASEAVAALKLLVEDNFGEPES